VNRQARDFSEKPTVTKIGIRAQAASLIRCDRTRSRRKPYRPRSPR
jgi:hypothetical protein